MIFSPWPGRAVITCDIADPESQFDAEELAVIRGFARPKRQREWMLSRIAEKELRRNGASGDFVSFSHSGEYGAAAVGADAVGIDIEVIRDISENAAHLFLMDNEIELMHTCRIAHRMLHFWSAKEALWKQRGGAVPTLRRVPLTLEFEGLDGLRFQGVETLAIRDLIAAITLPIS